MNTTLPAYTAADLIVFFENLPTQEQQKVASHIYSKDVPLSAKEELRLGLKEARLFLKGKHELQDFDDFLAELRHELD